MRAMSVVFLFAVASGCASTAQVPVRPAEEVSAPAESMVELATSSGTIHGTMLLPERTGPVPVALIIAGSGPTDRDGNSPVLQGKNDSLKLLAEGLSERGVATLRYDKRGIAASASSGPQESDLRFDMYVDDAAAWISWLRADPRFSSVSVIGHSEGSLIGMMAAHDADVDAFVSIAGAARPAADVLREQLRPQLPPNLWNESERILTSLTDGRTVDRVPPELTMLYRPSVQSYLISWLGVDPAAEIARLHAPVLIVQGTTDIQITVAEANTLHAARPRAELAIIEGMNHVLKLVPADPAQQRASYSDPALPLAPEVLERVSDFILAADRETAR